MATEQGPDARVTLEIAGLGILLYSPWAAKHIAKGDHYLRTQYWEPSAVLEHVRVGGLVGFNVGSPGRYFIELRTGVPPEVVYNKADYKLKLGLRVQDRQICFRDLYDLEVWDPVCPDDQRMEAPDGCYQLTLFSRPPSSGVLGDDQKIWIYFQPLKELPELRYAGVPSLV